MGVSIITSTTNQLNHAKEIMAGQVDKVFIYFFVIKNFFFRLLQILPFFVIVMKLFPLKVTPRRNYSMLAMP